jgi:phosphoribosyl-ATP pyrophosphohydrolase/phosphoribosyl-AMP cyclohydrolase
MLNKLDWEKMNGLLPVIIQDAKTLAVLMLGYMNQEALQQTLETKWVTFYSRSKNRLWVKGETSGNKLQLIDITPDCDNDTLLIHATPTGVVCHQGTTTCFGESPTMPTDFIHQLEMVIAKRKQQRPQNSYTTTLFEAGLSRITQKVGEEAIEVVLAAIEKNDEEFCGEVADLIFHLLVLLNQRDLQFSNIIDVMKKRSAAH